MPDIAMCKGETCPLKEKCYRFKAVADEMQSFFTEIPFKGDECDYFLEIYPTKKSRNDNIDFF